MKYTNKWMVVPYDIQCLNKTDNLSQILNNNSLAEDSKSKLYNQALSKNIPEITSTIQPSQQPQQNITQQQTVSNINEPHDEEITQQPSLLPPSPPKKYKAQKRNLNNSILNNRSILKTIKKRRTKKINQTNNDSDMETDQPYSNTRYATKKKYKNEYMRSLQNVYQKMDINQPNTLWDTYKN